VFKVRAIAGLPHDVYSNIRYYSNINLYGDYKNITSDILNKLVVNQGVSITQHIRPLGLLVSLSPPQLVEEEREKKEL
jgi:hypothetical protein